MKLLTPEEVLQAIKDDKKVEYTHTTQDGWCELDCDFTIENLLNNLYSFRLAQEIMTIGDVSFPKPETSPLVMGTKYWVADPTNRNFTNYIPIKWENDNHDKMLLSRGFIHLTKENAITYAKALIKLSGGSYE